MKRLWCIHTIDSIYSRECDVSLPDGTGAAPMDPLLEPFVDWQLSEKRACECGSFNVEQTRCAPNGVEATAFRCEDCGARWTE
jgi:hypothetical protein